MKKMITIEDIYKDNIVISEDTRQAGYNLGDLLNMPYLNEQWNNNPHHNNDALERMNLLSKYYKNSILEYYCKDRTENECVPNIVRIVDSVNKFNEHFNNPIFDIITKQTTLCVHIRNGDLETETDYINLIKYLSTQYEIVIILSGIHVDTYFKSDEDKNKNFLNTINTILGENIFIYLNSPDIHLSIMSQASNLLLHKGGFSCLGSIVSTGNLFITKYFCPAKKDNWINVVNKKYTFFEI